MSESAYRHPLHPVFVHFPIAFWMAAVLLDLLQWFDGLSFIDGLAGIDGLALAHLLLWAGVVAALPAVAAGFIDYARQPSRIQQSRALTLHISGMATAFTLFLCAAVWRVRSGEFAAEPQTALILLEVAGALCLIYGGAMAARVVFQILPASVQDERSD